MAIRADGVSKRFAVHTRKATSLKERLVARRHADERPFYALTDVTLAIEAGHTVGLIGANGSGKSTLLKVLAGILRPTTGTVDARGRIASLLELGAGFNGELSGRENVYLNASLLGLTRRETDRLFDSIVDFAELGESIDNPVKHYSSGMYVRLGFAVAVHVDPDILLVDEVLAVGDEAFARKCLGQISQFQTEGRTILFVSHALDLVETICDRGVVLDHGSVIYDGDPAYATGTLRGLLGTDRNPADDAGTPGLTIGGITVAGEAGEPARDEFVGGDPMAVRIVLDVREDVVGSCHELAAVVMGAGGLPVWVMRVTPDGGLPRLPGRWTVDFVTECPPVHGGFRIAVRVADAAGTTIGAAQGGQTFWVRTGKQGGLVDVPFQVKAEGVEW
ncbi:MAG: ABC transporter ATP-binding protein [Actinobacteria bacterium]|nr:ABC transporter ATP-binding protein [Actinomycetota bacterium]MBI3687861.1 ABC transporter ATP-binding protein [Actinomycetota bacterium]